MTACGRTDPHLCTAGAHTQTPRCAHCAAPDVIRDDGGMALVCPRCIAALGRIAADPYSAHVQVRERLRADHGAVVDLIGDRWEWIAPWPTAGDMRLVTGGIAR